MVYYPLLKQVFKGLVGWEKPYYLQASGDWSEMEQSDSGLFFNDAHPLMTWQNIQAIMPEDFYLRYPEWKQGAVYYKDNKVRKGKTVYICWVNHTTNDPAVSDWFEYPPIMDYLNMQVDKGITQMLQRFTADKSILGENKPLLERRAFFDGAGRINATLANSHNLVGFEIVPVRSMGVITRIEHIGFQGTGATGDITFYIFHTSQKDPIYTYTFSFTNTNGGFQWFTPEEPLILPYINGTNDAGGAWLFCYNQDDLPQGLEAINVSKDWSKEPCGTCGIGDYRAWKEITKYLQISPFKTQAPTTFAEFPEIPDVEQLKWTNTSNYGLNLEISVSCDLSTLMIDQRMLFANVLQLQVAYNLLRTMAMNPDVRVNRNQSNVSRMEILYELDGNTQGRRGGLGYELDKAYRAIELDLRGIDRICLPCNNHGVRYRTV